MGRPLKNSTILFKALIRELPGFQRTVRVRQDIPPHVAFDETIPLPERYASEILEDIHSFVETQVLSPIKPFLA